jgi:hypothetical protein
MAEPEIQRGVELYLAYFTETQNLHDRELGRPLEMYKETDPACVEAMFTRLVICPLRGADFLAELLHELAWSQCLGNGNRRTAMLFVVDFIESAIGQPEQAAAFAQDVDAWVTHSQAIIRRRGEWGYAQSGLENRHREWTLAWVPRTSFNRMA